MKHFISLGAGVQSSTMALMAAHGELEPMPDGAIFADTQDEPMSTPKQTEPVSKLPSWAHEVEELEQRCIHCGDKITVVTALALLGENGSYFCDAEGKQAHEIKTQ